MPKGIYNRDSDAVRKQMKKISELRKGVPKPEYHKEVPTYRALHFWVQRWLGSPSKCEDCGRTEAPKFSSTGKPLKRNRSYFQWANISGDYTKRILDDWRRLCYRCHAKFDMTRRKAIA